MTTQLPGNPYAELATTEAAQVPPFGDPAWNAGISAAYATMALAHEQRIANEIALEQLRAQPAATGRRGAAERIQARLQPPEPEETPEEHPAKDYTLTNYAAIRFELLRNDVAEIDRKLPGKNPDPVIRAVLDLIDRHARSRADQ